MVIKAILFDADGVIINSEKFSVQYNKKFNVPIEEINPFFKGEFKKCIIGEADLIREIRPWLLRWKWKGSPEEFLEFWFKAEHNIDENLIKMINKLRKKGIKCYLATNQEKYRLNYMKNQMAFKRSFDEIFASAEIGYKKPDTKFYEHILRNLKNSENINPNEIIFFDDSQEHVNEAKRLGINAYVYKNFKEFKSVIKLVLR